MKFPYTAFVVKTVNPQYGMALQKWFDDVGLRGPVADDLIKNLQKFRTRDRTKIG